jgi:tetratricopeptide (TPR) repeat protein
LSTTNAVEAAALASIAEAEQVIDRLHAANDPLLEEHLYEAWLRKGEALAQLGRHGERAELCDALIAHADAAPAGRALWIAQAFNAKGSAWRAMGEARREVQAYEEVERRFGDATTPEVRTWVAHAAFQRAVVAGSLGGAFAKVDMVRSCEDIVRRYAGDAPEATRETVARARIWRGELLADLEYPAESREAFDAAWRDLAHAPEPGVAGWVGHSRITQAMRLADAGRRVEEAIPMLDEVLAAYRGDPREALREVHARAGFLRADMLDDAGETERALAACEDVLAAHLADELPGVALRACRAMALKTHVLYRLGRDDEVPAVRAALIARFGHHTGDDIEELMAEVMCRTAYDAEEPEDVLPACDALDARFGDSALVPVRRWVARAGVARGQALRDIDRSEDAAAQFAAVHARFGKHTGETDAALVLTATRAAMAGASVLRGAGRNDEAIALYEAAASGVDAGASQALREEALHARLQMLALRGDPPDAQAPMLDALAADFGRDPVADLRRQVIDVLYSHAHELREAEAFDASLAAYDRLLALTTEEADEQVLQIVASALLNKGYLLLKLVDRPEEALLVYDEIVARFRNITSEAMRDTLSKAAASRQTCLVTLDRLTGADFGGDFPDLPVEKLDEIRATITRGYELGEAGKQREGIALTDQVLAEHIEASHPELRNQCSRALVNKTYMLQQLGQLERVIACADEMDARYGQELSMSIQERVALCLGYKSAALDKLGRHDQEQAVYSDIIARWSDSNVIDLRRRVARAFYCQGLTHKQAGDTEAALESYARLLGRDGHAKDATLQLWVAKAMIDQASVLGQQGDQAGRAEVYRTLIGRFGGSTDAPMRERVVNASEWLADAHGLLGQHEQQYTTIRDTLRRFGTQMPEAQRARLSHRLGPMTLGRLARKLIDRVKGNKH